MALFGRLGNLLKHAVNRQIISSEIRSRFLATRSINKAASAPTSMLFVGGISPTTTDRHLDDAFSIHGDVYLATVKHTKVDGKPRQFGLVAFTTVECATRALQALNGQVLQGRRLRINYTKNSHSYMDGHHYDPPCSCHLCEFSDNFTLPTDGISSYRSKMKKVNYGCGDGLVLHQIIHSFGDETSPGSVASRFVIAVKASDSSSGGTTCIGNNPNGGHDGTWGLEHGRA
uniref:RRM domain-containing protein n=1 Tax=Lotus japonicus TaxID=34305 RepID=I3S9G5_LOTJA|nr:unknown [Lotus japonicus]